MPTFYIHIAGQVQGIGFRPFVFHLATRLKLQGWVSNQADGVHIKVKGKEKTVALFRQALSAQAPALARIQAIHMERIADETLPGFHISQAPAPAAPALMITPDLALCAACRQEIHDTRNRRYHYAFTTCPACGPRYSILARLPYDRVHTTMAPFHMCARCAREYRDPGNRRYYAQTNSCPQCPVTLFLYDAHENLVTAGQQDVMSTTVRLLHQGKIIAVKGIGGYLLLADATNPQSLACLRQRKQRPAKPFALMYPDLETARGDVFLDEAEQKLLLAPAAPILLARRKAQPASGIRAGLLAPHLDKLGLMLPYTPLFELLLAQLKKPLVATSANPGGGPILFRDQDAFRQLTGIADFILSHNREILAAQDDSVLLLSPRHRRKIMLRCARGFAPAWEEAPASQVSDRQLLALGADMKSSFAFTASGNTYVSQYLGDLSCYDNLLHFEQARAQLTSLLDFRPALILTDTHPAYASVQLGQQLAQSLAVPTLAVQHHEAHFAAVLAENHLPESPEPVLGVIWDGTGLGNDGWIRGGEFLLYQHHTISPLAQVEPFPHLSGDKMAREPRLAALALCHDLPGADELMRKNFTTAEWQYYHKLLAADKVALPTTSMGRIFDAAAALLGICQSNSYEGEAAMRLEAMACREPEIPDLPGYAIIPFEGPSIPVKPLFRQLIAQVQQGRSPESIAARFHATLVHLIYTVAYGHGLRRIAFSGGVFQNSLLVDLIIEKLSPAFQLYFHRQLPANDGCISFGQLAWMRLQEASGIRDQQPSREKQYARSTP